MPKVSTVIPTMLGERRLPYLRAAMDSVLDQHYEDHELILVHNGSDPGQKRLVEEYLPRIRYCYSEIGNIGEARNTGVREARGEYVAFLDDDDLWLPDKLRVQAGAMDDNPDVDVLFADMELFTEAGVAHPSYLRHVGGLERVSRQERGGGLVVQDGSWFEYLIRNFPFLPSTWLGKRQVLLEMPFARTFSEDRELLWRLSRAHTLGFVDRVLVRKRDHDSNASLNLLEECAAGIVDSCRRAYAWDLTAQERQIVRAWEANAHFELGYLSRRQGRHLKALRHQVTSLGLAPQLPAVKESVKNVLRLRGRGSDAA